MSSVISGIITPWTIQAQMKIPWISGVSFNETLALIVFYVLLMIYCIRVDLNLNLLRALHAYKLSLVITAIILYFSFLDQFEFVFVL